MKKIIILVTLIVLLMSGFAYAQIGGEIGAEYSYIRKQIKWTVGANYEFKRGEIGVKVHTFTDAGNKTNIPPYVGFAPQSVLWTWYGEIDIYKSIKLTGKRYCEHWMVQSNEYNDYMGYSVGIKYEF